MPLDHGTVFHAVDSPRVALGFSVCGADVLLLDDEPNLSKFRGLESNQRPPGSEPGVTTNSSCPGVLIRFQFGEEGSNLRLLIQSQEAYR